MPQLKRCHGCDTRYEKQPNDPSFKCWCSPQCGYEVARERQERSIARRQAKAKRSAKVAQKADRAALRVRKESIKTIAQWKREAQTEVNKYIRARDAHLPCISCDQPPEIGQRHASHYRSVGACSQLRFNTWNIHASCAQCNSMKSGNILEYRIRLIQKIGIARVDWLECQNEITKVDIEYLRRVKRIFSQRSKRLERLRSFTDIDTTP